MLTPTPPLMVPPPAALQRWSHEPALLTPSANDSSSPSSVGGHRGAAAIATRN